MNLAAGLVATAAAHPDHAAIRLGDDVLTYGDLDAQSAGLAGQLAARGLVPGDRVGVMLPNVAEFAVAYYAVLRAGGVVVPMNPLLKAREVAHYLGDSGARLAFVWTDFVAAAQGGAGDATILAVGPGTLTDVDAGPLADVVERADDDTAVILYTSGTTGTPKGAELTHANLVLNRDVSAEDLLDLGPGDVVFGGLPLFHAFGQTCALNATVRAGATLTLLPRFEPVRARQLLAAHRVTVFAGVPTMYSALLGADGPDLPDLRVCISGGAALPVDVLHRFESAFGAPVLEGYGLSETSPVASFNQPGRPRKPGSIGTPIRGVEMRIVDDGGASLPVGEAGEITVRGHNVMKGYWNRPEATATVLDADGWFRTGDVGRTDEDGYFFVVDRKKDLIIRGGYNVYPREIEEVLYEHPAVAEAAVVGLPHPELGEEVGAAVALRPGVSITADELREYVKSQVAAYKYPRHVWLLDALPKGPTGKILKREIALPELAPTRDAR